MSCLNSLRWFAMVLFLRLMALFIAVIVDNLLMRRMLLLHWDIMRTLFAHICVVVLIDVF